MEDNCQTDTRVKTVIADIESRDGAELKRLCGLMVSSGLISDTAIDSGDTDNNLMRLSTAFDELLVNIKLLETKTDVLTVRKATAIQSTEYGNVYPMSKKPRGYCVIIDNEFFTGEPIQCTHPPDISCELVPLLHIRLRRRTGTTADANRLSSVFKQLYFCVKTYKNKTVEEMKALLADIAADSALIGHDALAVIILSHGATEGIYGTDGVTVALKTILEMFNNENCPQLIDKPKMFFLSACRGGKTDPGTRKSLGPNLAAMGKPSTAPIVSTWSDMFVYYSTIEGYVSTRNIFKGSWFGQELGNCLAESAHREHLNDLVTIEVAKRVSDRITDIDGQPIKQAIETHIRGSVKKDNCQPDTQLVKLIDDIKGRGATDVTRLCQLLIESGLVSDVATDSSAVDLSQDDGPSRCLDTLKILLSCVSSMDLNALTVTKATAIQSTQYGNVYPMARKPRGYCVIIDNEKFNIESLKRRLGTKADANRLYSVFHQLFFDVRLYRNKTSEEMETLLADIAADKALEGHNALAVIMLSHGSKEGIYGTDGFTVALKDIFEMFNNEKCPQLIDKPKMFFINACRGSKIDPGIRKSLGATAAPVLTTWSDMFVYYSSIQGYISTRNILNGSWFGQELADCLAESAHREHLNDIMTIDVAKRVSEKIAQIKDQSTKQAIETLIRGSVKKDYCRRDTQLPALIAGVVFLSRNGEEVNRLRELMVASGLVVDNNDSGQCVSDGSRFSLTWLKKLIASMVLMNKVKPTVTKATELKHTKDVDVYPMTRKPRGYCVIIDNEYFDNENLETRFGTITDVKNLTAVFDQLFFDVKLYNNKSADQMKALLADIAADSALVGHDALVVIMLSHGAEEGIYGTDGVTVPINTILEMFNNKNCPQLLDKPKMFFTNACRGRYVSFRSPFSGSWFGQHLAKCLAKLAHREHLNDIMTIHVAKRVGDMLTENDTQLCKQAIETTIKGCVKKDYCRPDTQLPTLIADIASRSGAEVNRLRELMVSSGLVSRMTDDHNDSSQCVNDGSLFSLTWLEELIASILLVNKDELTVTKATKLKDTKYGDVYPMAHKPRGYCVIIDNEYFEDQHLEPRFGTIADAKRLSSVFDQLFFDVKIYTNKKAEQMKTLLGDIAADSALIGHDALAVIMLSHGAEEGIYGTDGVTVSINTILEMFNNKNCPQLIDKPKMFFTNACRGVRVDHNYEALGVICLYTILPWRKYDLGYVSKRDTLSGSWFGQHLAKCLAELAHREHLNDIMTIHVAKRVGDMSAETDTQSRKQAIEANIRGSVKKGNCEADTQLATLIADIESRSGDELSRLCGLMISSGLVSDTVADSVDSGQCVNDGPKRYLKAFKD
ncbi:unnamed protein product, partial [Medioppia subpectinata]